MHSRFTSPVDSLLRLLPSTNTRPTRAALLTNRMPFLEPSIKRAYTLGGLFPTLNLTTRAPVATLYFVRDLHQVTSRYRPSPFCGNFFEYFLFVHVRVQLRKTRCICVCQPRHFRPYTSFQRILEHLTLSHRGRNYRPCRVALQQ